MKNLHKWKIYSFKFFGSEDSSDTDVMAFVKSIGQPHESTILCQKIAAHLTKSFVNAFAWASNLLDVNLAVIENGVVVQVYKGSVDEVNNSLIDTYHLHQQLYPLHVDERLERDISLKILRAMRGLLSLVSRTHHRQVAKSGLNGNVHDRLTSLRQIPISSIIDLATKNIQMPNYYKVVAFQIGQTMGLLQGMELYTKSSIAKAYPELKPFLYREKGDVKDLDTYQEKFLDLVEAYIPQMSVISEL